MERDFKRVSRDLVYTGSILNVYKDHMVWDNGHEEDWDFVSHRNGAACVIAIDDDGKIIMVRQYRSALERETIEVPAGSKDSKMEDSAVCAARELEEETGYKAGKLKKLLSVKSTVAFCDELIDVYLATNLTKTKRHLDPGEQINVEKYTLDELLEKIFSFEIQDGKTISAIPAYKVKFN